MFIDNIYSLDMNKWSNIYFSQFCLKSEELNSVISLKNIRW